MPTRVHLVLGGGAMLGIGHIGAFKALSRVEDLQIVSIAGTSAGALFGALIATRHTATELEDLALQRPFLGWLDPAQGIGLTDYQSAVGDFSRFSKRSMLWGFARTCFRYRRFYGSLTKICAGHPGVFSGQVLEEWVRSQVSKKVCPQVLRATPTFADLDAWGAVPLKIVATNLSAGIAHVFGKNTPGASVAMAVRASTSLPLVYQAVRDGGVDLVDGGLVANLPVGQVGPDVQPGDCIVTVSFRSSASVHRKTENALQVAWASFEAARNLQPRRPNPVAGVEHIPIDLELEISPLNFYATQDDVTRNIGIAYRQAFDALAPLGVEEP